MPKPNGGTSKDMTLEAFLMHYCDEQVSLHSISAVAACSRTHLLPSDDLPREVNVLAEPCLTPVAWPRSAKKLWKMGRERPRSYGPSPGRSPSGLLSSGAAPL